MNEKTISTIYLAMYSTGDIAIVTSRNRGNTLNVTFAELEECTDEVLDERKDEWERHLEWVIADNVKRKLQKERTLLREQLNNLWTLSRERK